MEIAIPETWLRGATVAFIEICVIEEELNNLGPPIFGFMFVLFFLDSNKRQVNLSVDLIVEMLIVSNMIWVQDVLIVLSLKFYFFYNLSKKSNAKFNVRIILFKSTFNLS